MYYLDIIWYKGEVEVGEGKNKLFTRSSCLVHSDKRKCEKRREFREKNEMLCLDSFPSEVRWE